MYLQPLRWLTTLLVVPYYHSAYRIRGWGTIPSSPGPKLLVANHQHEIEASVLISDLNLRARIWRRPIFTVSSRRMWEPGFLAERIPWLSPVLRSWNTGWLFSALGMQPIENELHVRPFVSVAYTLAQRHSDIPVDEVFSPGARARLPASVRTLRDLLTAKHFAPARERVKLTDVIERYRKEILDITRSQIEADLGHFENLQRSGATIFLTPEGHYSGDGKMQRFRGALSRLAPLAEIWLAGISYDPFAGRRLSMLYRVAAAERDVPLDVQLKRLRPVTLSALLGSWLHERGNEPFDEDAARSAVRTALAQLPRSLFVDPELSRNPNAAVDRALTELLRLGALSRDNGMLVRGEVRTHPQFPRTADIVEYQYNFHQETLDGARWTPTA